MVNTKNEFFLNELIKKKNIIIFSIVSILAIHHLLFLHSFEINFPYSVDFSDEFNDIFYFITEGIDRFFATKGFHIIFFPKLISYPFLYLGNFDVSSLYYLQWLVISVSLYIFYLIIKQTDRKLVWTIIPISAFLYNPLTSSGYWAISLLPWLFSMLGISLTVYFLNRKKINPLTFGTGIFFTVFSVLSIVVGITAWLAGLIIILKNSSKSKIQDKKWISLWVVTIIIIGIFYFYLVSDSSESTHLELLFTPAGFSFITHYLASSFRLKFEFLMIIVGSISLLLSCFFVYYFAKKQYIKSYLPWFVFLLIGVCAAIITASGRVQFFDTHFGNEPYYSPISQFFQIGLLVLSAKLVYEFKNISKRNALVIFFIILIIAQMILLIPSYYAGWQRGEYYYDEKTQFVSCFSLNPDQYCQELYPTLENKFLEMINYLIINKQSIFNDRDFNKENDSNIMNFSKFQNYDLIFSENNKIDSIDKKPIYSHSVVKDDYNKKHHKIVNPLLSINGRLIADQDSTVEEMFMLIDNKPMLKINDYNIQTTTQKDGSLLISWSIQIMSGYIESGCHSVNLVGITEGEKIYSKDNISICR